MNANKPHFDVVFVVLVYKNTIVLSDFFKTLNIAYSYHVIVVNSFYDSASEETCRRIAKENNASYMSVENRGYGYGNNEGCAFALSNFDFNHLIISNSDIIVKELDGLLDFGCEKAVIAPHTEMINGHKQNPNIPIRSFIFMSFLRIGYKYNLPWVKELGLITNRVYRELFLFYIWLFKRDRARIFSPHGSFIIFTKSAVEELSPIFNSQMFLYNEELFLAYKCNKFNVPIYYMPGLKVLHLEGASSSKSDNSWTNKKKSFNVLIDWMKNNNL